MRFLFCALVVFVTALCGGYVTQPASAAVIPGITSLQDLINLGPLQSAGVQIGNDVFYNFSYAGSPAPGGPGAPTPSTILVTSTDSGPGLHFAFPWSSTLGNNQTSNIAYSVHVVTTVPQQFINNAILDFQSSVNATSLADTATTTETLGDNSGHNPFAEQSVLNTGTSPAQPISTNIALTPTRDFGVSDGIVVHTATNSTGSASITFVDNIFGQSAVPEPTSLLVLGAGMLSLVLRRSRRRAG